MPSVCRYRFKINRDAHVTELAGQMNIHGYLSQIDAADRFKMTENLKGFILLEINEEKGKSIVSSICMDKADTDPIAGKLLVNMLKSLIN